MLVDLDAMKKFFLSLQVSRKLEYTQYSSSITIKLGTNKNANSGYQCNGK